MTLLIPIGDVELRLDMIARGLGIPAATLDKLASGEWVAVPREQHEAAEKACSSYYAWEYGDSAEPDAATLCHWHRLAAATEAASHDD